jgi:hypothetical protein
VPNLPLFPCFVQAQEFHYAMLLLADSKRDCLKISIIPSAEKNDVRTYVRTVMPTQVGIHDLRLLHAA